ncbi:integral membrane protein [Fusarium heterosporum]|uniref:Integral membrane protein n=1 Tax=Fusarium heterosporum TaxID=42747 RepID=A0A8H5WHF3_FUSHE|nr:integral membrane protein [Fusarium heterosporum]
MAEVSTKSGSVAIVIAVFISVAFYNVLELNAYIFISFKKRSGLYFWSFVVATWGIAFNGTGYLIMHLSLSAQRYVYSTLILIGWCTMVSGQSIVLYSRLHIVMHNQRRLRMVLTMIILNAIWLHLPIIVLVYGTGSSNPVPFQKPYEVFEKIQLSVFFVQEIIISGLYVWETTKRLRLEKSVGNTKAKMVLNHLIVVNFLVVLLDVSILALEFANLFDIQTAWKPLVYSVKLKLEFSILNRLIDLTKGRNESSYGRSHGATHTDDVGLETLGRDGRKQFTGVQGTLTGDYEVRVGKGEDNHRMFGNECDLIKTTEIRIHSERYPGHGGEDRGSTDGAVSGSLGGVQHIPRGSASSASSEIQFAKYCN